jgi:hypothetical protein
VPVEIAKLIHNVLLALSGQSWRSRKPLRSCSVTPSAIADRQGLASMQGANGSQKDRQDGYL